jgi:hypothetical protein
VTSLTSPADQAVVDQPFPNLGARTLLEAPIGHPGI